ncbi:MAG TPA: hypothetical protein VF988_03765 [Verrucomicrobiae bacterium]
MKRYTVFLKPNVIQAAYMVSIEAVEVQNGKEEIHFYDSNKLEIAMFPKCQIYGWAETSALKT